MKQRSLLVFEESIKSQVTRNNYTDHLDRFLKFTKIKDYDGLIEVQTHPRTGDPALDAEAFRKWQLIRLPAELGGEGNSVTAFRVFSNICLHLWCLWEYKTITPQRPQNQGECPCHGSTYDPLTGISTKGPASLQAAPSNVLPKLDIEMDSQGFLYLLPPKWGVHDNGIVGYGRFL